VGGDRTYAACWKEAIKENNLKGRYRDLPYNELNLGTSNSISSYPGLPGFKQNLSARFQISYLSLLIHNFEYFTYNQHILVKCFGYFFTFFPKEFQVSVSPVFKTFVPFPLCGSKFG
jgi:hypothetical protein